MNPLQQGLKHLATVPFLSAVHSCNNESTTTRIETEQFGRANIEA